MSPLEGMAIERRSTADQVANLMRERILRGDIRAGTPLREVTLAASIGVSRNTLREALRVLIEEGLVRHSVHRGISVTQLSGDDVADIYHTRRLLETKAVQSARPKAAILDRIEVSVDRLEGAARSHDWLGLFEHDLGFHCGLVALLGSSRLDAFYGNLLAELRLLLVAADRSSDDLGRASHEHRKILKLLRAGKGALCARLVEEHLQAAERRVAAFVLPRAAGR
jgi:DNA-binding GntR family transcriptional regulator